MGEMSMSDKKGNEITFERDGTVTVSADFTMCDRCEQYAPKKNGQEIKDHTGQVIMWFCFKCRLMQYQK